MNKNMISKLILVSLILLIILVTGCKKVEEEVVLEKDPEPVVEVETPKDPNDIMKEFYQMINGDETVKNITMFIINSIENLEVENADTMILDFEGHLIQDLNILLKQYERANSNPKLSEIFQSGVKESMAGLEDVDLKDLLNRTLDNG